MQTQKPAPKNPEFPIAPARIIAAAHNPPVFPPLELETRSHVETACAAFHLMRKPQTMRAYACLENGPIRPVRINGRLAWPVAAIRALLEGIAK